MIFKEGDPSYALYKSSTNNKWKIKRLSDKKNVASNNDPPTACPVDMHWDMYADRKATEVTDCNDDKPTVNPTTTTTTKKPTPKPTTNSLRMSHASPKLSLQS